MATLTDTGRIALAKAIYDGPFCLAWGSGDPAWDSSPIIEPVNATGLVSEIARRVPDIVSYVVPDSGGTIEAPFFDGTGVPQTFSVSAEPSRYIYFAFQFDKTDAPTSVIREVGLYYGTTFNTGNDYHLPSEIVSNGALMALEYLPTKIVRSADKRCLFEFVLTL